jgi:hypothetical protein
MENKKEQILTCCCHLFGGQGAVYDLHAIQYAVHVEGVADTADGACVQLSETGAQAAPVCCKSPSKDGHAVHVQCDALLCASVGHQVPHAVCNGGR